MTTQKEHLEAVNAASAAEAKEKAMEQRLNKAKADLEEHQRVQKEAAGSDTAVQAKYKVRGYVDPYLAPYIGPYLYLPSRPARWYKVRAMMFRCCHDGGAWC